MGIDLTTVAGVQRYVDALAKRYRIDPVTVSQHVLPNNLLALGGYQRIVLSDRWNAADLARLSISDAIDKSPRGLVLHEFGHVLINALANRYPNGWAWVDSVSCVAAHINTPDEPIAPVHAPSAYGATNLTEFQSETFVAYHLGRTAGTPETLTAARNLWTTLLTTQPPVETALAPLRKIPATGVLYHYTGWYALKSIIESNRVHLTFANSSDIIAGKINFPYYLSLARTPQGKYGEGMRCVIVFRRDWLAQHGRLEALDYWGPGFRKAAGGRTESEDRLYAKRDALILPADLSKAIVEVHFADKRQLTATQRRLLIDLKKRRTTVYVYSDENAMKLLDTRKALRGADLIAHMDRTPEDAPYQRGRRKVEAGIKELLYASHTRNLGREGKYALRKLLYYGEDQTGNMPGWDADIHNNKTNRAFLKVYQAIHAAGGAKAFFTALARKWIAIQEREENER